MNNVTLIATVLLLVFCAVQATRFVVRYSRYTWKATREGRHLMSFTFALALILWATLLLNVVPVPLWVALALQVLLLGWLGYELTRRNHLLTLNQRRLDDE